jgi:hypothetical protein
VAVKLLTRQICHVQVILVGAWVEATDDAELLGIRRLLVIVFTAVELDDYADIDVLAVQVSNTSKTCKSSMSIHKEAIATVVAPNDSLETEE